MNDAQVGIGLRGCSFIIAIFIIMSLKVEEKIIISCSLGTYYVGGRVFMGTYTDTRSWCRYRNGLLMRIYKYVGETDTPGGRQKAFFYKNNLQLVVTN